MSLTKLDIPKGWEKVVVPKDWRAFYDKHGLYNRIKKTTISKITIVILCSLFALNVFSTEIVRIDQSGSGSWGVTMLAPFLIINQLDTIPVIDSVVYEKIRGDFYKREYTSEYAIFYTMPEDSTSLDADSVAFDIILDSLYREFDVADRRINRLRDRIDLEQENKRELRNQILDATIRQRELLRIRRRYYRQL